MLQNWIQIYNLASLEPWIELCPEACEAYAML